MADFLRCIDVLAQTQRIAHQPKLALYHLRNGEKAAQNLFVHHAQRHFTLGLARVEAKQCNAEKHAQYLDACHDISAFAAMELSSSLRRKLFGSLNAKDILTFECVRERTQMTSFF